MNKLYICLAFVLCSPSVYSNTFSEEDEKIAIFCKMWGFLKYYHPVVAKGSIDWDKEFVSRVNVAASLSDKEEISTYYSDWISTLGEIKPCNKCDTNISDRLTLNLNLNWLSDTNIFNINLIKQLEYIHYNRNISKNFYVSQNAFIGNTIYENENKYIDSIFPSSELRMLGLARYWNIITYFYPYKYIIDAPWDQVLLEMIPKFKYSKDTMDYHLAMLELTAKINDSHAYFSTEFTKKYFGLKWTPFKVKIIDNVAIVTEVLSDSLCIKNDIQYGDIFLRINDQSIEEIINSKAKYIPASNNASQLRNISEVIFNGNSDSVNVIFERKGEISQKYIYRYEFQFIRDLEDNHENTNYVKSWRVLDGNIGYVDLGKLQRKEVKSVFKTLQNSVAIILDVRNYPNGTMYKIMNYLNTSKQPFAKATIPDISNPGLFYFTKAITCGRKNKHAYLGKVVLLFNENSQSHAEFTLMALKTAPDVIGIGSQTAGADGNVSIITFPGNYRTYMSGVGVYYPDGRETQRVGIVPDIEINPTIQGLRDQRDEVLEAAVTLILKNEK